MTDRAHRLRRDLRIVFADGIAYSAMVGLGESYLPAFVLAVGLGEVASGLIVTLPLLAGGVMQLLSPVGLRRLGSRRRWAVLCATMQAAAFLPLIAGAWVGSIPGALVFLIASLYWGMGMAITPAWNVWVEALIPARIRAPYFGRRASAAQMGAFGGLIGGGLLLDAVTDGARAPRGFALLFGIAAAFRFLSAWLLSRQSEPVSLPRLAHRMPSPETLRQVRREWDPRLLVYLLTFTGSVTLASPFFSAYMLAELDLPYGKYTALVGASLVARIIVLPIAGRFARRIGMLRMLRVAWLGITPLPALWLLSDSFGYLLFLQVLSGVFWAIQEYATFLLLLEAIPAAHRTTVTTAYNLGNAVASVGGSLIGGALFGLAGTHASGFRWIFASSTILRVACLPLLARIAEHHLGRLTASFRVTAVRAGTGGFLRPILASVRPRNAERDSDEP